MKMIPEKSYKKILQTVPLCYVDLLIHIGNKFLLFKRKNLPVKGEWWFPGGRIFRGESIKKAIMRKAKEEIGIDVKIEKLIGVYEVIFRNGYFGIKNTHTVGLLFLVTPMKGKFEIKLDKQHSEFKIFNKINKSWHPYVINPIKDSGILNR